MSLPHMTVAVLPKRKTVKRIGRHILVGFISVSLIAWSIGVPLSMLLPIKIVYAAAPTISLVAWKTGSTTVLVTFSKGVFNDNLGSSFGPMGSLTPADFTLSTGTITAVQHDGGSTRAILTLAAAPSTGDTIACSTSSVWSEGVDNNNTPEACGTSTIELTSGPGNEDVDGPTSTITVNLFSNTSFSVKFSEAVAYPSTATSSYWTNRIKIATVDSNDPYTGAASVFVQDVVIAGDTQNAWGFRDNWNVTEVFFDIYDANIDPDSGANSIILLGTGSNKITDVFGNALNSGADVTMQFDFTSDLGAVGLEALAAYRRSATVVDIVFSNNLQEASAENTAFYTLVTSAADTETIDTAVLCKSGDCPVIGAFAAVVSNKVVRITAGSATIGTFDFATAGFDSFPDTIRVNGEWDSVGAPKDESGNLNHADWPIPIETGGSPDVDGIGLDGNVIQVRVGEFLDPGTVATTTFTFTDSGSSAKGTVSSVSLSHDKRDIFVTISGATPINGDILEISTTTASGVKDIFGETLQESSACTTGDVDGIIKCTVDASTPTIARVTYVDVDSSNSFNQNDIIVLTFTKDMDPQSAPTIWDWDLLYGASCNVTVPTDSRNNCQWGWWGDGASVDWTLNSDGLDFDGSGNNTKDDVKITLGNFPDIGEDYIITPWWDQYSHTGLSDEAGNGISNVGIISSTAGTINSVQHTDVGSDGLNVGDTVAFIFSKRMVATSITAANANTALPAAGRSNEYGNSPTVSWSSDEKTVTITLGASFDLADGDVVDPASSVIDMNGNPVTGTVTFRDSSSWGGGLSLTSSSARYNIYLEFPESIVNQNYSAYPAEALWAAQPIGNTYISGNAQLSEATHFAFTDDSGDSLSISRINYISRDGKKIILKMSSVSDPVLGADTINAGALVGGGSFGVFTGANDTATALGTDLTDTTGPTINSVSVGGGGGFGATAGTSDIGPGTMVRIEFSEPIDPGSFFNHGTNPPTLALDTALVLPNSHTWGSGVDAWFWSSNPNDFEAMPDIVEITLGQGTTFVNGDTITPSGVTDLVGNVATGSSTFDSSVPKISKIISTLATPGTFAQNDTVAIVFNTEMNVSGSPIFLASVLDDAFYLDLCAFGTGCTQGSWGTNPTVATSTTFKTGDTYTIILGSSPTIGDGYAVWAEPMYIVTAGGKSIWDPGMIDISVPTLTSAQATIASGTDIVVGDVIYFSFSGGIDQATITNDGGANDVGTVLPPSAGDYGATPTLSWEGPGLLKVTIANAPSAAIDISGSPTVTPTTAVKNIGGVAIAGAHSAISISQISVTPPASVVLSDPDTSFPGVDKNDISVAWTASTGSVDHYNVYILEEGFQLNIQSGATQFTGDANSSTHRPINSTGISSSAISFLGTASGYEIFDDSRFEYLTAGTPPPSGSQFFPIMGNMQYRAYVVACANADCSSASLPGISPVFTFTADGFQQSATQGTFTATGMAIISGGTGGAFAFGGGTPWVEGTMPFSGQSDIPTNTQVIGAKFSEPLNESTLTSSTFIVEKVSDGADVAGTLSYINDKNAVIFKPSANLTASTQYQIRITTGMQSTFGSPMMSEYISTFTTGSGIDSTAPTVLDNKFQAEGINTSSVSPLLPEIGVRFADDLNPATVTSNSVKLYQSTACTGTTVSGSVDYDPWGKTLHFWLNTSLKASQGHCLKLFGSLVKDISGNAMGTDYTVVFTTGTLSASEALNPQINWADADNFHIGIGFNAAMKESTVTNSANWTLESPTGTVVQLTGVQFFYDSFFNEVHIDGLQLTDGQTFTITANQSVKGLNGKALNESNNSSSGTVHGMMGPGILDCGTGGSTGAFTFGCNMDNPMDANVMMFMPMNVWPQDMTAGITTNYFIDMPLQQAIDDGGEIILTFPSGFDVKAAAAVVSGKSFANNDLNGPGPGVVTISSVTPVPMKQQIRVALAISGATSTGAKDFISFDLSGIKNTSTAASMDFTKATAEAGMGGYQVTVSTKDSTGKTLESNLKSMPFPIEAGGNGRITIKIKEADGTTNITGTARVFLDNSWGGHREESVSASDNGTVVFRNLKTTSGGIDYWIWVEPPKGQGYFAGSDLTLRLDDSTNTATRTIKLKKGSSTITATITHAAGLAGEVITIGAWGNDGWTDATTSLSGTETTATLSVKDGTWNVGVMPYFGDMMMMTGPMPDMAFMPPPEQFVTVKGSASVSFTLTSIGSTDRVSGFVYDENGNGLPDVDVWAHDPSGAFGGGDFVRTDPTGAYSLRLPVGDYKVGAGKPGLGHTPERLVTSPTSGVNFTLNKGAGSVKGYVLNASSTALGGAVVNAKNFVTNEVRDAKADSKTGAYAFFLPAGTWTLTAKHPSFSKIKTDEGTPAASYSVVIATGSDVSSKNFKVSGTYYTISGYICAVIGSSGCTSGDVGGAVVWAQEVTTATGALTGEGTSESTGTDGYYLLNLPASSSGTTHYNLYAKIPKGGKLQPLEGDPAGSGTSLGINLSSANVTKNWAIKNPIPVDIIISGVNSASNNSAGNVSEMYLNVYDPTTNYETSTYKKNATSTTLEILQKPSNSDGYVVKLVVPGFGELSPDSAVTDSGGLFDVGSSAASTNDLIFTLPSSMTIAGSVTSGVNTWVYVYDKSTGIEHGVLADSNGDFSLEVAVGTYNLKAEKKSYKGYKHATTILADTTGLSLSLPANTTSITGTAYESNGSTLVSEGYVVAKEHGGTGTGGAKITDGSFTLSVDSGSRWDIFVTSNTGFETIKTDVAAGASQSFTLATIIPGYESVLTDPSTVSPSKGSSITDSGVTNSTTTDVSIEFMPNSLSGSDELSVSIDNLAGTHESPEHKVVGSEKSIEIERGRISSLDKPTETTLKWSKAEVQEWLANDSDIATTTLANLLNNTNIGHFEENIGNDGEWVAEPTIARAKIKNGSASTTFVYEDFSTFVTNVVASSTIYYDYEVEFKTMATKMSIRGTVNSGLSDETAPYVNNDNTITAPTVVSTTDSVTLDWSSLTESCISGVTCLEPSGESQSGMFEYNIYRSASSFSSLSGSSTDDPANVSGVTQVNASQIAAGTQTFTDSGLSSNATYYYVITAVDLKGNGDQWQYISSEVQIVTAASGGGGGGGGGGAPILAEAQTLIPDEVVAPTVSTTEYAEGTLIRGEGDDKVYVIKNKKKLWIPTAVAFSAGGYKWSDVQEVSASNVAAAVSGQLIRVEGSEDIYVIKGNRKRHIPSAEAFVNEGYKWDDVTVVGAEHGVGFKTANLLRTAGDIKVYIVEKGLKRHITNSASFNSYNYDWDDVVEVTAIELTGYGAANLMRAMDTFKVYLLEGATRQWIQTAEIFNSYGYDWNKVLDVSSVELESYSTGAEVTEAKTTLLHRIFEWGDKMLSIF